MIISQGGSPKHLSETERAIKTDWEPVMESPHSREYISTYCKKLQESEHENRLEAFKTFLPPRLVAAAKVGNLVPFFGSGLSASAGIPTWPELLKKLGVSQEFSMEPQLENDPLTTAELLAHEIGMDQLQNEIRSVMRRPHTPTLAHYLLCQLSQPIYITCNYDRLFEIAWASVNIGVAPIVITSDTDFLTYSLNPLALESIDNRPILLKIHGCAQRDEEELILTRSQYRRHYRSNNKLFDAVRTLLESHHILFLGFGHRDPEITRLVEDVIHRYETGRVKPALYSLQFDMKERTPEVFAARGIVALQPPITIDAPDDLDYRSVGVAKALVDLLGAMDSTAHQKLNLDDELASIVAALTEELQSAMKALSEAAGKISSNLDKDSIIEEELKHVMQQLGSLSGQGVYLLRDNGDIRYCALPQNLVTPQRSEIARLHNRFYVQQARTYRKPFISDSDASVFNMHSTIFLCQPLGETATYKGLLFSAAQIGAWLLPLDLKKSFLDTHPDASFVLVDSNGVVLLPPNKDELEPEDPRLLPSGENPKDNVGFVYARLQRLSRRDLLVSRIWRNIVPLSQDDDVYVFSDLKIYSVVTEVPPTRWKLALSIPLP